jgi:hypothetical protein
VSSVFSFYTIRGGGWFLAVSRARMVHRDGAHLSTRGDTLGLRPIRRSVCAVMMSL